MPLLLQLLLQGKTHLLLHMARCQVEVDLVDEAQHTFKKARVCDELNLDLMDYYAVMVGW